MTRAAKPPDDPRNHARPNHDVRAEFYTIWLKRRTPNGGIEFDEPITVKSGETLKITLVYNVIEKVEVSDGKITLDKGSHQIDTCESTEKERRIYYQDIVYAVCIALDTLDGNHISKGTGIVCGTADEPSNAVQERMALLIESLGK